MNIYNNYCTGRHAQVTRARKGNHMDIIISNASSVPIYEQIEEQIKSMILTGVLKTGDAIPSMRVLAKDLKVSIITTKRAFEDLERDGFIESVVGKGSFVKGMNAELVRESMLVAIEEYFDKAVDKALIGKISCEEMQEILRLLYEEKSRN